MTKGKIKLTQKSAENSPAGGVVVGERNGQTMIYDDASVGGYFVGKTHSNGGIKMINKSNGQPLEVQGSEVIITAPAVADQTKREFEGKMMTNREILSAINEKGGGVAFAKGGDVPKNIKRTGASYKYGGKTMTDHEIYKKITGGHLAEGMTLTQIAKMHKVSLKELQKQVDMGMKAESEHTSSKREQMKIVKDHLYENPKYYTLLKKVGLKHGGKIHKESLVRDAKSGNTPARDLNNYNDMLDVEADGQVGGDSGLFVNGGEIQELINQGKIDLNFYETTTKHAKEYNINSKNPLYIQNICVLESERLKGIGKKILDYLDNYAIENGNDVIFGYINNKASFKRDSRKSYFCDTEMIKHWLKDNGYAINDEDNNFHKVINQTFYKGGDVKPYDANMEGDSAKMSYSGGGGIREAVDFISIANYSDSIFQGYDTSKFNSFAEFKVVVKDLYSNSGATNKRKIELCINNINNVSRFAINISKGKNTNSNFNPFTGTFLDLVKNLKKYSIGNYDMFNWDKWLGVINSASTTTQTSSQIDLLDKKIWVKDNPDLSRRVQELGFANGFVNIDGKTVLNTEFSNIYFVTNSDGVKYMYILDYDKDNFDNEPEIEVFEADLFPNTSTSTATQTSKPIDLLNKKIWVKDNPTLKIKVLALANAQGFTLEKGFDKNSNGLAFVNINGNKIVVGWQSKSIFDTEPQTEIFESDLFGTSTATAMPTSASTTTTTALPNIDLLSKKIWIGDNPDLSRRVQELAFKLGFKFDTKNPTTPQDLTNDSIFLFSDKEIISSNVGKIYFDENSLTEITEADLFGTSTATATQTSSQIDLKDKKIWIGDNPDLSRRVQEFGFANGYENYEGKTPTYMHRSCIFFGEKDGKKYMYILQDSRVNFDKDSTTEIFESDLFGTTNAMTTSAPIDLTETKIWIGQDEAFSEKIQKRVFELGWFWDRKTPDKPAHTEGTYLNFWADKTIGWSDADKNDFDKMPFREIFESDLFPTSNSNTLEEEMKNFDFSSLFPSNETQEDWVKKFTADLDKLVIGQSDEELQNSFLIENTPDLLKAKKDLDSLVKLLPSFQQKKYAVERAKILNEIKKLHKKITYEGFIKPNEATSSNANLFTPQGLLDYYFTQSTQNPTAELEPACELPTPNGEKSKLPLSAYLNVRTLQFKKWFGDWEKAYENGNYVNCSKMIDPDTKEPKIYFHGVRKYVPNFGQFSNMGEGVVRPYGAFEPPSFPASFFAGEEEYAKFYGGIAENMPTPSPDYKPFIYKVFLSIKNPISLLPLDFMLSYKDFMDYIYVGYGVKVTPNQEVLRMIQNDLRRKNPMWIYIRRDIGLIEMLKDYGYDALFQMGDIPTFLPNGEVEPDRTKHLQEVEYLTFYPSQVKSATVKKSFYFDFFNDIRFKNGGYVRI